MNQSSIITIKPANEGGYVLTAEMVLPVDRDELFAFFSDARQLETITPDWLNFSILTPMPVEMKQGLLLDYRLSLHRIPIRWRTEIAAWQPPYRFVDQQLRGPYKRWHHEHLFEEVPGGTKVVDRVNYIPRGGSLIHKWFVKPDLLKIFKYRQDQLHKIFGESGNRITATPTAASQLGRVEVNV